MHRSYPILPTPFARAEFTLRRVISGLRASRWAVGWLLFILILLIALFPQALAPYNPKDLVARPLQPPSTSHWLGTNDLGQDLFSELIWGTRASLTTGLVSAAVAVSLGTVVGMLSAARPNDVGTLLMRLADLTLVIPLLPLIILLSAYLGPSQWNIILILSLVFWAGPARLIRSRAMNVLQLPYVEAAIAVGCTPRRVITAHVWPAVRSLAVIQIVLVASASILAEASLSFLGLGDPATRSWGATLYFARVSGAFLSEAWQWWVLPAGLSITVTVLTMALINYGLEIRLEPTLKR